MAQAGFARESGTDTPEQREWVAEIRIVWLGCKKACYEIEIG
jgi:hypothetical protein